MEEENGLKESQNGNEERTQAEEVFTKIVRAGKRTYFFDVKATRKEDYYLTITESKKRVGREGKMFYEKHKIFLYREDFEKFAEGLREVVAFISNEPVPAKVEYVKQKPQENDGNETLSTEEFTNIDFDDLGKK
jgi:hypothetical protein